MEMSTSVAYCTALRAVIFMHYVFEVNYILEWKQ
mgnify:CR=1 FL=1|jgi:hypothetical protein